MKDLEMVLWVMLLEGRGSSNQNTIEVPFAVTKTIEKMRLWFQKQIKTPYPASDHISGVGLHYSFNP